MCDKKCTQLTTEGISTPELYNAVVNFTNAKCYND